MSVARKAGWAAGLLFLRKCWFSVLSIFVFAYLASTLEREAFGVVGIASVILSIIQILGVSGVCEYVIMIKKEAADRRYLENAAFWFNATAALLVVVAGCCVAPFVANYYEDPQLIPVILIMLSSFLASMISSIPKALYRKEINYGPLVAVETIQQTVVVLGQLVLAWKGFGVFSLVLPGAVVGPVVTIIFLKISPLRIGRQLGYERWSAIFSFTKHIVGSRLMARIANEGDYLVIGAVLNTAAVGTYYLAYRMANILFLSLVPVVVDVSLPVFCDLSEKRKELYVRYTKMLSLIMFVMFPLMALLFVNAKPLSIFLYASDVSFLVQILVLSVIVRCVSSPSGGLFTVIGRPEILLYFVLVFTPIYLGSLAITAKHGLEYACMTVALCFMIGQIIQLAMVARIVFSIGVTKILAQIFSFLIPTLISMAFGLASLKFVEYESLVWEFIHGLIAVTTSYYLSFRLISRVQIDRIIPLLKTINPKMAIIEPILTWPREKREQR